MTVASEHPVSILLAFIDDELDEANIIAFRQAVDGMNADRRWALAPPTFVDYLDDGGKTSGFDEDIRTVGCELRLYSATPPWGDLLPRDIDHHHLMDVEALVARLAQVSREFEVDIGFELDGNSVGWLVHGEPDELLAVGLLGEWGRRLNEEPPRSSPT
jgi:hypothetical protein